MKHIFLTAMVLWVFGYATGQQGQMLVTGNTDVVGLDRYPSSPYLLEADGENFYWISGASNATVDHPFLKEVFSAFKNIYFIKYNKDGSPVSSNYIRGTSYAKEAFSFRGGLNVMSRSYEDVNASGNVIPLNGANYVEFIASYDADCNYKDIVNIWNLLPSQYVNSTTFQMDPEDGSLYVYGTADEPVDANGIGVIGKGITGNYFFLLKYGQDLQIQWAYSAGFDPEVSTNGYYNNLKVHPDMYGNVVITGSYQASCSPLIDNQTLSAYENGYGLFAVKLDAGGSPQWVQEGPMNGYGYDTHIFKSFAMKNGDLIMAGVTTTGYFKLGEAEFSFVNGMGSVNQFVFRMGPGGKIVWIRPIQNMGYNRNEGKKSADSDEFREEIDYDAIQWNGRVLYMTGSFLEKTFIVADRVLPKNYFEGIFVAAIDLRSGEELWGYGLSSESTQIYGFDVDRTGNISLMGYSTQAQDFEGIDAVPALATAFVFHLGLDYKGAALWQNNAHPLSAPEWRLSGVDLEVLPNGKIFSSMYLSQSDHLEVGDNSLFMDYPYTSWLVELTTDMELGGKVSDESGNPVSPGYVKAYKAARSGAYPAVDSTGLGDDGRYLFTDLLPGNYTLRVVPDATMYTEGIPTYIGNKEDWSISQFNDLKTDTRVTFMDITLSEVPKLTVGDGAGTITGNVNYEEEEVLKGTMGRPVKKASVILLNKAKKSTHAEGDVVAYIETDEFGNFSFENIPDGDYILIVNITGLEMLEVHEVTIEGDRIVAGLDYTVSEDGIYTYTGVGISVVENEVLEVFPNPGNGLIVMDLPSSGDYSIRVFSSDGRMVKFIEFNSAGGIRTIDISGEDAGMYFINITGPETDATVKYLKK